MVSLVSLTLAGFGLAILFGVLQFAVRAFALRKFVGPVAFPIVGNLYDTRSIRFISFIGILARQFGKFFVFWSGNTPFLVISDPNAARQILTDNRTFIKGADYTEKFKVGFGEGLVTSNGDKHKHDRQCLGKYFIASNIEKYLDMICAQTLKMNEEVIEPHVGKSLDLQHYFHILTLRVFSMFAVDHDFSLPENHAAAEHLNKMVCWGSNMVGEHIVLGIPMWNIFPRVRKLKSIIKEMDDMFDSIIDKRIMAIERGEDVPNDPLTALIADGQTRKELQDHVRTMLCAGHDTTAYFGCYMSYLLAQNPRVQDKLREEIQTVLQGRTRVTKEDIDNLKYCRMVMQETLRIYTIIPFVNRTAVKDTPIKETSHVVPKDTVVLIPLGLMNRDPEMWDSPSSFRPERFENITGHTSAKHGYLPFGYGPRTCVGNTLALMEATIMISLLLSKYRFLPEPGFKPQVIGGISLVSKNGVVVQIEKLE